VPVVLALPRRYGVWLCVRLAEILICLIVLAIAFAVDDQLLEASDLLDVALMGLVVASTYGVFFLYWPISAVLWAFFGNDTFQARVADSTFYLAHCYASMTLFFNGPPLIVIPWDFSPAISVWLAQSAMHVVLVMTAVTGRLGASR
jgi:hypothetical protein